MAKALPRPVPVLPKPEYSPGYTWMLLFTLLSMGLGCGLLYLENDGDYGFVSEPKGGPPAPKIAPLPPRDAVVPPPPKLTQP